MSDLLDVLVRFHNPARSFELRRALFAVVCQSYRPVQINLLTQRFSPAELAELERDLAPTLSIDSSVRFRLINYTSPEPKDARSALLNLGIRETRGRYLAFLDHDDSIFPEAYTGAVAELLATNSAIAFGSVASKELDVFQDALIVLNRSTPCIGENLLHLLKANFCPIHSFVIDRRQVDERDLTFNESLSKLEDYEFLLRFCVRYTSSFRRIGTYVGDYYQKNDGTNTLTGESSKTDEALRDWHRSTAQIDRLKGVQVISPQVQKQLGIFPSDPNLTIAKLLDSLGAV